MDRPKNLRPLPQDIIRLICQHILLDADPSQPHLWLDPYIRTITPQDAQNNLRTTTLEPTPIVQAQQTLKSLCLVSHQWNSEARKALWSSGIQFGLPRSFETVVKLVDPIGSFFDGGVEPTWLISPPPSRQSSPKRTFCTSENLVSVSSGRHAASDPDQTSYRRSFSGGRRSVSLKRQGGNYILQPHSDRECPHSPLQPTHQSTSLSPVWSDEHRRAFERSISPLRGRIAVQALSQAFRRTSVSPSASPTSLVTLGKRDEDLKEEDETEDDEYIFDHHIDDLFNPAPYITSVSFSKYRSHGMRRSVAEGHQIRFVTPERLCRLLRSTRSRYSGLPEKNHDEITGSNRASEGHLLLRKGKLEAVGFSEYMDSAITKGVLDEILLRGGVEVEYQVNNPNCPSAKDDSFTEENHDRGRARSRKELYTASHCASPHHTLPAPVEEVFQGYASMHPTITPFPISFDTDSSCSFRIERRLESSLLSETPVKALDLCGCISSKFRSSLKDFIIDHALSSPYPSARTDSTPISLMNTPNGLLRWTRFPFLTRLGLSRVMILDDLELSDFLSGFVNLLDLDLSHTRAGKNVLHTLQLIKKSDRSRSESVILRPSFRSLNLAKCRGLTKENLVGFLCGNQDDGGASDADQWEDPMESIGGLEELSLHGDLTQPTPLDAEALDKIFSSCPALLSGRLTTLDFSSVLIDDSEFDLKRKMPVQPRLLQLGLGSCPHISLETIRFLLKEKMNSVEILDISSSCLSARQRETRFGQTTCAISTAKLHTELISPVTRLGPGGRRVSNLRVIELDDASLQAIRGGAGGWKAAFGKGQRGWYVDLSVAVIIVREASTQDQSPAHPRRQIISRASLKDNLNSDSLDSMESLTEEAQVGRLEDSLDALKNSDETIRHTEIGWMSRKTEILHGSGLLGRQEGLYGFHAFASN
ncbi:hypothetical protein PGT21_017968 [Puccinia graminis f. sp. tritici]|uniref:Uncharacterized protein n=2 Tax=Puccinia graminis f. sp. tritici TaxID=56615 RepID=A0A5B0N4C4_PUCGR|nr:hypothetical protein PGT21_017968 [Puccinia graminis f. sp. tritici]KAA1093354.1 hypothetical protein PGTUg99_024336 [Puccinia graminis f. sp. tritici]